MSLKKYQRNEEKQERKIYMKKKLVVVLMRTTIDWLESRKNLENRICFFSSYIFYPLLS